MIEIILIILSIVLPSLMGLALTRSRSVKGRRDGSWVVLSYGLSFRLGAIIASLFFGFITFMGWSSIEWGWQLGSLGLVTLAVLWVIETLFTRLEVGPEDLIRATAWRPSRMLAYKDIDDIRYNTWMGLRIQTRWGEYAYVSEHLSGLGSLADALLNHVSPDIIDELSWELLV